MLVVCSQPEFEDPDEDTLLNPTIIVEVLSPSTEAYDRGGKFGHYQKLPSLKEYLLVSQERRQVEHFVRQADDRWLLSEMIGPGDVLLLPSAQASLRLADLYDKVRLD